MLKTCEGWESNPHTEVPDPKSGASANSATLAMSFKYNKICADYISMDSSSLLMKAARRSMVRACASAPSNEHSQMVATR